MPLSASAASLFAAFWKVDTHASLQKKHHHPPWIHLDGGYYFNSALERDARDLHHKTALILTSHPIHRSLTVEQ